MIFYFSLLVFSVLCVEACPAGWNGTEGGDFCYLVSDETVNWYSAEEVNTKYIYMYFSTATTEALFYHQFCYENGGYLAEFFSSEEEARADAILSPRLSYWIGLADFATEGPRK